MKKILLILALLFATVTARAEFPYATTTWGSTQPIQWYYLAFDRSPVGYIYAPTSVPPNYSEINVKNSYENTDAYKWCFVQMPSGRIALVNKAKMQYLNNGMFFTLDQQSFGLSYVVQGNNSNSFYICYDYLTSLNTTLIIYLNWDGYSLYPGASSTESMLLHAEAANVQSYSNPAGQISFSNLDVQDENCSFTCAYSGNESHTLKVYINGTLQQNASSYTIERTDEAQQVTVRAEVFFNGNIFPIRIEKTYEVPARPPFPYATTTWGSTEPIQWYFLTFNASSGGYLFPEEDDSGGFKVAVNIESGTDEFMWCFMKMPSGRIALVNLGVMQYMDNGLYFTLDGQSANLCYVEYNDDTSNFYIFYTDQSNVKRYLNWTPGQLYPVASSEPVRSLRAEHALEQSFSAATGQINFSDLDVQDENCSFTCAYSGNEAHSLKVYIDGTQVQNASPYTIERTDEARQVTVRAEVYFNDDIFPIYSEKTYEVPAQEIIITELAFTPYDVYTPNNVQTDSAENYLKLFDKDRSTKWCVDNSTGSWETIWVDFMSNEAFIPTGYTMTTGNDTQSWQGRNPKKWKIYAKAHENDEWTTIVDVTDGATAGLGTANTTDYSFNIDGVDTGYQYFRFEVSELCGKGGWQNNHYVFQLAELALTGEITTIPEPTPPFVPTPSLMSYPIHWYQLKINDKYVYYNPDATYKVSLTSTESTDDAYLWCFEELAPDSIVIYNKSEKKYMRMGNSVIWTPTASMINYAEAKDETGFYVYYYNGNTKYYHLEQPGYDVLAQTQREDLAQLFNAIEVLVEEDHGEIKDAMLIPTAAYTPNNANTNENEDYRKLFDKDKSSKWCVDNSTGSWETIWADFKSKVAFIPTSYTMTTASDTYSWQGRNPKKWKIYAKANETDEWTTIVDVTDGDAEGLGVNGMVDYSFPIDGLSTKYQFFRFEVSEVRGQGGWQNDHYVFQLAELFMRGYTLNAVPGDSNGDSRVDVNDVTTVINYILGKNPSPFNNGNADVNGDGDINVLDVTLIINIILGIS